MSDTLRDRFAMAALTGLLASLPDAAEDGVDMNHWARAAYCAADAMLKESTLYRRRPLPDPPEDTDGIMGKGI